jgi:flagellar P-ring protein precursor FlgI
MKKLVLLLIFAILTAPANSGAAQETARRGARLKDVADFEGIRDNPLVGYGLVVGLNGTGDRNQTIFSTQTLANILQRMGVQIPPTQVRIYNVAAVFVTATLPPFARPGMQIDVTVSSIGDAKSLQGGLLLLTPLAATDGKTYAIAQGAVTLGGYSAGKTGNSKQVNHPTVGRIPEGAIVERDTSLNLKGLTTLSVLLRDPDFATARDLALTINHSLGKDFAHAIDSRRIELTGFGTEAGAVPQLLAAIEDLPVKVEPSARVIVNERTGTVVLGGNVSLSACSILHGNLTIDVVTEFKVSQPQPFSKVGQTEVVPEVKLKAGDLPAQSIQLQQGATVEDLVHGLQQIGATARDIIAILQAMKQAGALQANLEVI